MSTQNSPQRSQRAVSIVLTIALLAAVIAGFTVFLYRAYYRGLLEEETLSLGGYNREILRNLERAEGYLEEYRQLTDKRYYVRLNVALMNWMHLDETSLNALMESRVLDDYALSSYILTGDMEQIYSSGKLPLSLSEEQILQLAGQGTLRSGSRYYASLEADGYLCIVSSEANEGASDTPSMMLSGAVPYIVLDNDTGEVLYHSADEVQAVLADLTPGELTEKVYGPAEDIPVYAVARNGQTYLVSAQSAKAGEKNITVCAISENTKLTRQSLYAAGSVSAMLVLFAVTCVLLVTRLGKKRFSEAPVRNEQRPEALHRRSFRYILISSLVGAGILFCLISSVLFFLSDILYVHDEVSLAFDDLLALDNNSEQNRAIIEKGLVAVSNELISDIEQGCRYSYDISKSEWLSELARILNAQEISVYDAEGVITASSTPYVGYRLSKDEADDEHKLWGLLNGSDRYMTFASTTDNSWYLATRRTDDVGFIVLRSTINSNVVPLLEKLEFSDLLTLQDHATADAMYSLRSEPGIIYILKDENGIKKIQSNSADLPDNGETHIGMRRYDGQYYLYIDIGKTNWVAMYAYPLKEILTEVLMTALAVAVMEILIAAAAYLLLGRKSGVPVCETEVYAASRACIAERDRIFSLAFTAIAVCSMVIVILRTSVLDKESMLSRIIDNWDKSVNLVSIAYILLSATVTVGLVQFFRLLEMLLRKWLSPKQSTVVALLTSVINAVLIVCLIINSLEQLGVNAVAITASLGLTGVALGIGSKDVISDLVAGIFIILEGKIQIGDFISVGDFTGRVEAINIRTTTLRNYNEEMIVNNTNLKNIKNVSRGDAKIRISFVVPYATDMKLLENTLNAAAERLRKACKGTLSSNPVPDGIQEYKDYGMEWSITAFCPCAKQITATVLLRTELKRVLDDAGIPFAQKSGDQGDL